jgi:hypothetical protein
VVWIFVIGTFIPIFTASRPIVFRLRESLFGFGTITEVIIRKDPMAIRNRRELVLDRGRVFVEVPQLMSDDELTVVFEAFVREVRGRPGKSSA